MQVVNQLSGARIGRAIPVEEIDLLEFPWWNEEELECPAQQYVATCDVYWQNVSNTDGMLFL